MADDDFEAMALDAVGDPNTLGEALSDLELAEQEAEAFRDEAEFALYTSESIVKPGYRILRTLPVVTARRVEGLHLFKDIALTLRDTFGGRSNAAESAFEKMEREVLEELDKKIKRRGGSAGVHLRLQYGEISGSKSQMFYVAGQTTPVIMIEVETER